MCSSKFSFTEDNVGVGEINGKKQSSISLGCSQCSLNFYYVFQFASEAEKSHP